MKQLGRTLLTSLALAIILLLPGCGGYPSCGITFKNKSANLIWVDSLTGVRVDRGPTSCGNLAPGGTAGIRGVEPVAELTKTAEIVWWIDGGSERPTDLEKILKYEINLPPNLPKDHEIVFVYHDDGSWTATIEKI